MSAQVGPVHITLSGDTGPMVASVGSVFEHLAVSSGALDRFADFFPSVFTSDGSGGLDLSDDCADLLFREAVAMPALGTNKIERVEFNPSDRYFEAVAALVASDGQLDAVLSHGWPILSVVSGTATVAKAGSAASAPRGGLA